MAGKTKAEVETTANNEVIKETPKKKTPRKFEQDEPILCRSVTYGELLLPGKKSKLLYTWANYNDTTEVEYQDLQALRSTHSQYLYAPKFVIDNEELLEQWPDFKGLYDKVAAVNVDELFDLPISQFRARLSNLPLGFKESVKNIANAKILDGSLDSIAMINALDEILGTDLKLQIQ